MSKWLLGLASIAMLAFAMSGCGGSDGSSSTSGATQNDVNEEELVGEVNDFTRSPNQFVGLPKVPSMPDTGN
ncbi:MAG: hypothetical protein RBR54_10385 [Sulfurimonas sp.]|nr:hypothetical protein [Sulfurimonas sp.]